MKAAVIVLIILVIGIQGLTSQGLDLVEVEEGYRHLPTGTVFPRHDELEMETVVPFGYSGFYSGSLHAVRYFRPDESIVIVISVNQVYDTIENAFNDAISQFHRDILLKIERSSPPEKLIISMEIPGYAREFTYRAEFGGEEQIRKTRLEFYLTNGTGVLVKIHGTHDTAPEAVRLTGEILGKMTWPQTLRSLPISPVAVYTFRYEGKLYRDVFWGYNLDLIRELQEDKRLSTETINALGKYRSRARWSITELFLAVLCADVLPIAALAYLTTNEEGGTRFSEWSGENQAVFLAGTGSMILGIGLLVHSLLHQPMADEVLVRANADLMDYQNR